MSRLNDFFEELLSLPAGTQAKDTLVVRNRQSKLQASTINQRDPITLISIFVMLRDSFLRIAWDFLGSSAKHFSLQRAIQMSPLNPKLFDFPILLARFRLIASCDRLPEALTNFQLRDPLELN